MRMINRSLIWRLFEFIHLCDGSFLPFHFVEVHSLFRIKKIIMSKVHLLFSTSLLSKFIFKGNASHTMFSGALMQTDAKQYIGRH